MQMLWVPGEPEFVLRSGAEVDDRDLRRAAARGAGAADSGRWRS